MTKTKRTLPYSIKFVGGTIIFVLAFIVSMIFGAANTSINDVWAALSSSTVSDQAMMIREIRLPREIAAMLVGAALSVSGAIMQGLTRNPLADPGLLGLTAGANVTLAISIALLPFTNYFSIMIICMIGAAFGAFLVLGISSIKKGGFSPFRIVLAGAAISAFLTAIAEGIGLYFKISKEVSMWTAGGMIGTTWTQLQVISPFIIIGIIIALCLAKPLTILSLNEELAVGLGQNIRRIKTILFIVMVLLAGASVALVGNLTFVGLMIPHIVRAIVGTDYRAIIPMSTVIGAAFMLMADTLGRTINAPYETPVAAIVSLIGLPFFLLLVRKGGRNFG
ncbi:FecCD family ABC transporter permease [Bacillus kexueae]|uniref:FecCD family ABC transporter permease n=1 Tax=Aeribacillus kexueae TaxID=2078952 RepID=UPI001FAE95F5|nr:iron ABC transporter permease [Bacillus kexueae]